jgi:hypothetical protein
MQACPNPLTLETPYTEHFKALQEEAETSAREAAANMYAMLQL